MKLRSYVLCVLLSLCLAAYVFLVPAYLQAQQEARAAMDTPQESYTGILTLWHIVGFKPYIGSLRGWLSDRADKLEKEHFGVFAEVEAMTVEEYEQRRARGEYAHIYSFPAGLIEADALMEIDAQALEPCDKALRACGAWASGYRAAPYAHSGTLLLVNTALAHEQGLTGDGSALLARSGSAEAFLAGEAVSAVGDAGVMGAAARRLQTGKGFAFEALEHPEPACLVQLIGFDKRMTSEQLPYALEFLRLAYAPKAQAALCVLGLFPATEEAMRDVKEEALPASFLFALYRRLRAVQIPSAFA